MNRQEMARRLYDGQKRIQEAGGTRPEEDRYLAMHYDDWAALVIDPDPLTQHWVEFGYVGFRKFRGVPVIVDRTLTPGSPRLCAEIAV